MRQVSIGPCFFFFLFFFVLCDGVFVRFSAKGVASKTPQTTFWGKSMSTTFYPKNEGEKGLFPVIFFLRFFIAFLAVSLHEELKNT
jgi:hypothetical protein